MAPADDHPEFTSFNSETDTRPAFDTPEAEASFRAAVQEGMDDVAAGRTISGEAVLAWMRSWFTDHELPPPQCGD